MVAAHDSIRALQGMSGLGEALFPGTRRKVLGLVFREPDRAYSLSELIEAADAGSGAVQREVERLAGCGLLAVDAAGRQKRYRANRDAPIFDELCSLVAKTMGVVPALADAVNASDDAIRLALVYGSVARGSDRADSDIDLLLVSDSMSLEEVFAFLAPVEDQLGRKISPTLYTSDELARRLREGNPFLKRVLAGKHIWLKGDMDAIGFTAG